MKSEAEWEWEREYNKEILLFSLPFGRLALRSRLESNDCHSASRRAFGLRLGAPAVSVVVIQIMSFGFAFCRSNPNHQRESFRFLQIPLPDRAPASAPSDCEQKRASTRANNYNEHLIFFHLIFSLIAAH